MAVKSDTPSSTIVDSSIQLKIFNDMAEKAHREDGAIVYESSSSRIVRRQIIAHDTNTVDFCSNLETNGLIEVAIKSLTHLRPSHEDLMYLNNEYHILTRYLANCNSSVRRAIGRTVANTASEESCKEEAAPHAIYFEWAEGLNLQDLIEEWRRSKISNDCSASYSDEDLSPVDDLLVVRLMHKIALALAEIHKAGVIHNDLVCDNIIVDFETNFERDTDKGNSAPFISVNAKIIDFGFATTMAMAETNDSGETVNDDLYNLGVIYRNILLAIYPSNSSDSVLSSLTRNSMSAIGDNILADSIPNSLCSVVSCLTCCETNDSPSSPPYKYVAEVVEDLVQMLEDPDVFLYEHQMKDDTSPNLAINPEKLYGRSEEVEKLLNAYNQVCNVRTSNDETDEICPEMVLVAGYGGSGKTTLVQSLEDPVINSGGYFVTGKYDVLQRNEPYSALIKALADLCTDILARDNDIIVNVRENIMSAIGSEGEFFLELIPNLSKIVQGCDEEENQSKRKSSTFTNCINAQNKLNFAFRRFMRAVATYEHPLVMVLDDLQWADIASLNLIQNIMSDSENKSPLLLIGCYRDNEVCKDHPLLTTIYDIERLKFKSYKKKIDEIKIDNLHREDLNMMLSDALLLKRRVTRGTLTDLVYQKTCGNVLFSVQFLKSLVEDGLIFFHPEYKSWCWDEDGICKRNVSNSVVELLAHKIETRLSENARNILKIAACIGSTFEVKILNMVVDAAARGVLCSCIVQAQGQCNCDSLVFQSDDILKTLEHLVGEGLLKDVGHKTQYQFAHDRIHQASYASISKEERTVIHNQIGEIMWKMINPTKQAQGLQEDNNSFLFRLTDQLNRGANLISDDSKKISLARLNLRVGEICMKKSAFQTAVAHLEAGIRLLDQESCWQEHYNLVLHLHNIAAEAHYSTGNLESVPKLLEEVFSHTTSFEDKLNAYSTQMLVLGKKIRIKDAIAAGLETLSAMGEEFPTSVSHRIVLIELMKTKWMLRKKSEADLLNLPLMTNKTKIAAMHFLCIIILNCTIEKPLLFPLVTFRMIRLSISYGICESSPFSFALFGFLICEKLGDTKGGYKYGQLALSLAKKHGSKECLPKVYAIVFGGIKYWSECHKTCIEQLLDGYKFGMEVGDFEYASVNALLAVRASLLSGESLIAVEKRARILCHQFAEYNEGRCLRNCVLVWQTALNLLGKADDPGLLAGEAMNFEAFLNIEASQTQDYHEAMKCFFEMYLAFMFGRSRLAAEKSKTSQELLSVSSNKLRPRMRYSFFFYDGLNNIDMANTTDEKEWRIKAQKNMKRLKKAAKISPTNHLHVYHLIQAGCAMLNGNKKEAARAYDVAITASTRNGYCNHIALAYEKAAIFSKKAGFDHKAAEYFSRAHQCYLEWGAEAKADHLYTCWISNQ